MTAGGPGEPDDEEYLAHQTKEKNRRGKKRGRKDKYQENIDDDDANLLLDQEDELQTSKLDSIMEESHLTEYPVKDTNLRKAEDSKLQMLEEMSRPEEVGEQQMAQSEESESLAPPRETQPRTETQPHLET